VHPRLLTTRLFTVHSFGVLLAAAYLAALWWLFRGARRSKIIRSAVQFNRVLHGRKSHADTLLRISSNALMGTGIR
jgi:hypothetical protein